MHCTEQPVRVPAMQPVDGSAEQPARVPAMQPVDGSAEQPVRVPAMQPSKKQEDAAKAILKFTDKKQEDAAKENVDKNAK